jgi:tRNA G18 (ribose-2'-O)-methylase SpoU
LIQLTHSSTAFKERKFPIVLVLDSINSPANVGSLFRLADAFNIEKIIFCGNTFADLSSSRLKRTARSTVKTIPTEDFGSTVKACLDLSSRGYSIFALEITNTSEAVDSLAYNEYEKIALVIGNENAGIEKDVLKIAHKSLHINMFGNNSSMNVAQAAGIALFEITKSLLSV